ncbi:LytTR family DNA-binding domain-containing protein [uncultured Chryseobacterium sp.]|uniref:LytR/AlgR family response regulator transcription factor n=1 Tax=uncultured Chryseobacterium sp. TaxID=259322 RepID=UPI0025910F37|nr:LytTR family DNA-binding domain-containing protein [uncultured Chryseobacterium sp.]
MKIVIIEDEQLVAEDLYYTLKSIDPEIELMECLSSVSDAVEYFSASPNPDIIFSDIQLGDGLSFEIYQQVLVDVPIIFCTAFDDYAIEAFRTSSIDYILKPYSKQDLENALLKFNNLKTVLAKDILNQYEAIEQTLKAYRLSESATFMIRYRDRYLPTKLEKIAFFYLENEISQIHLFSGEVYFVPTSLEEVEKQLNSSFFRANRQYIVNRSAISEVVEYFPRKLKILLNIPFKKEIIISKEKKSKLLQWLNE